MLGSIPAALRTDASQKPQQNNASGKNEPQCSIMPDRMYTAIGAATHTHTAVTQHGSNVNTKHITVLPTSNREVSDITVDEFLKLVSSLVPDGGGANNNNTHNSHSHNNNNHLIIPDTTTNSHLSNMCATSSHNVHATGVTSLRNHSHQQQQDDDEDAGVHFVDSEYDVDEEEEEEQDDTNRHHNKSNSSRNSTHSNNNSTNNSFGRNVAIQQTLEYCPNYFAFDRRARKESKERISSHLRERQKLVIKCVDTATQEIVALGLPFVRATPKFEENGDILQSALVQLEKQIERWDGVQIRQCKKEQRDGTKIIIDSWQKFAKKAKNHQDQTSWKISGDFFFAPYIKKVKPYLECFCSCIGGNIPSDVRLEIVDFGCISFALFLLSGKIKFHRTKLKPLIRHRTLVKSSGIQTELQNLYPQLTVHKFIQNAKQTRKKNDGKNTVIASEFYKRVLEFAQQLYQQQRQTVIQRMVQHSSYGNGATAASTVSVSVPMPLMPVSMSIPVTVVAAAVAPAPALPPPTPGPPTMHTNALVMAAAAAAPPNVASFHHLPFLPNDISVSSSSSGSLSALSSSAAATPIPSLPTLPPFTVANHNSNKLDFTRAKLCSAASPTTAVTPQKRKQPVMLHSRDSPACDGSGGGGGGSDQSNSYLTSTGNKKRRMMNGSAVVDEQKQEEEQRDEHGEDEEEEDEDDDAECNHTKIVKSEYDTHHDDDNNGAGGSASSSSSSSSSMLTSNCKYKIDFESVLSMCDGSCGNHLGRLIADIIHGQSWLTRQQTLDILAHKFGQFGNKMRTLFIDLISSSIDQRSCVYALCVTLQNEHVCISHNLAVDAKWIAIFIEAFTHLLQHSHYSHIIQRLARQSCRRCDLELFEEVEQNLVTAISAPLNQSQLNFDHCQQHVCAVKNTAMYRRLKLQGHGLTNNEILAVYFCHTYSCIFDEFSNFGNSCKWKVLFENLCAAIRKIYHALIYRVEQSRPLLPHYLYYLMIAHHHKRIYPMRPQNEHPLALHTVSIVYNDVNHISNIHSLRHNDRAYLMTLCNVQNALFDGRLIAAPIDWLLDCSDHCLDTRWLLLPTICERAQFQNEKENISSWKIFPSASSH